jgi:hypothetical protein
MDGFFCSCGWNPNLLLLMTEYYKTHREEGLEMPKKIKDDSKQYQMDSDIIGVFWQLKLIYSQNLDTKWISWVRLSSSCA